MTLKKVLRVLFWIAFIVYLIAVIGIMFLGGRNNRFPGENLLDYISRSVNLIPFKTIGDYIRFSDIYRDLAIRNIGGNLLLFLPMGFFLPVFFPLLRKLWKTLLVTGVAVLFAECLQILLRRGIFDIDDLILNLTGALCGYFVYRLFWKISCKNADYCGIL